MRTAPVLALDNLVKDFAGKRAVDQISLTLRQGEIMGLLGPNGAGKTTTIRMIMNIIAPDSGRVEIFGQKFNESHKNKIGYLPEERGLYRKLKVSETLQFFGKLKGMDSRDIETRGLELLKEFSLEDSEVRRRSALLTRLGEESGGGYYPPETVDEFPGVVGLEWSRRTIEREFEIWNSPWLLVGFVGLVSLEWTLRRRKGLP